MRHDSKYGNIPRRVDNVLFASGKEARRYTELKAMQDAGIIRDLELQPKFDLEINGVLITRYVADFRYWDNERRREVVEDSKGMRTQIYVIKERLMKAILGIEIENP